MGCWKVPPIFELLQQWGGIEMPEMFRTFNCGIGMMIVVPAAAVEDALKSLHASGETAVELGEIVAGHGEVHTEA